MPWLPGIKKDSGTGLVERGSGEEQPVQATGASDRGGRRPSTPLSSAGAQGSHQVGVVGGYFTETDADGGEETEGGGSMSLSHSEAGCASLDVDGTGDNMDADSDARVEESGGAGHADVGVGHEGKASVQGSDVQRRRLIKRRIILEVSLRTFCAPLPSLPA